MVRLRSIKCAAQSKCRELSFGSRVYGERTKGGEKFTHLREKRRGLRYNLAATHPACSSSSTHTTGRCLPVCQPVRLTAKAPSTRRPKGKFKFHGGSLSRPALCFHFLLVSSTPSGLALLDVDKFVLSPSRRKAQMAKDFGKT